MPELPEVETVRQQLRRKIVHRVIDRAVVLWPKTVGHNDNFSDQLAGRTVTGIDRVGKLLIFATDDPEIFLLGHLKMTGQFLFVQNDQAVAGGGHTLSPQDLDLPHKHSHVHIHFTDGSVLYFNDQRKFGYVQIADSKDVAAARAKFGIEPGTSTYTRPAFEDIFSGRSAPVKAVLLNQQLIAGLGNIYVEEVLFRAGIRPDRPVQLLTQGEKDTLFTVIEQVLAEAIAAGGTTFYSFRDTDDGRGNYYDELMVFDRTGEPCLVCGAEVKKMRVAGRGTHYCPRCQK